LPGRKKCRRVGYIPKTRYFKPRGVSLKYLEEININIEEMEAVRLKDYQGLDQEESARLMGISRQTFQRILTSAHSKIADALLNGKALHIEGGDYCLGNGYCRRERRFLTPREICPIEKNEEDKQN